MDYVRVNKRRAAEAALKAFSRERASMGLGRLREL
jgi:hypothetical protein